MPSFHQLLIIRCQGEREMNRKAVKLKGAQTGWFSARPEDKLCQNQEMASKQKVKFKALPGKPWSSDRPQTVPINHFEKFQNTGQRVYFTAHMTCISLSHLHVCLYEPWSEHKGLLSKFFAILVFLLGILLRMGVSVPHSALSHSYRVSLQCVLAVPFPTLLPLT